jgi:hypothetical protein
MGLKAVLRVMGWVVLVYCVLEVGFRIYRFEKLKSQYAQKRRYGFSSFREPIYQLDQQTGYAYIPKSRDRQWLYDRDNNLLAHSSSVITNNFGMISPHDAAIDKPRGEFRIAVLGDSFCATTTSDVTWPAAFEDVLNGDENLKRRTGNSAFKVLNFGLDGTGIVQWPSVYKNKAAQFNPDLVVVNFIWDDIYRRFIYRSTLTVADTDRGMFSCTALPADIRNRNCQNGLSFIIDPTKEEDYKQHAQRIKAEIYEDLRRRLPWFSLYPELLASVFGDRLGLRPRLDVQPLPNPHYATADEAVTVSLNALKEIASMHPRMIVLFYPTVEQCLSKTTPPVVQQLINKAAGIKVINMLQALPTNASQDEIRRWYNLPYDGHPSSYGAQVYAEAAEGQVKHIIVE